jgi:hypothetical protein
LHQATLQTFCTIQVSGPTSKQQVLPLLLLQLLLALPRSHGEQQAVDLPLEASSTWRLLHQLLRWLVAWCWAQQQQAS